MQQAVMHFLGTPCSAVAADLGSVRMTCKPRTCRCLCVIMCLLLYGCSALQCTERHATQVCTGYSQGVAGHALQLHYRLFNNVSIPTCQNYGAASCSGRMHASLLANNGFLIWLPDQPCSRGIVNPHACKPCPYPCGKAVDVQAT